MEQAKAFPSGLRDLASLGAVSNRERTMSLNEGLKHWLNAIGNRFREADRLLERTPEPEKLPPEAQRAYALAALLLDHGTRELRAQQMRKNWEELQALSPEERRQRRAEREEKMRAFRRSHGIED